MLTDETRREIRRIEIVTSRLVDEVFGGQYSSLFKGQGVEFAEVREYQPGDDVRSIDWNLTARFGRPYVKKHEEERELTLVLAVDVSGSQEFGSQQRTKAARASEIAAVLAFSALRSHDKVGLLLFSDRVEKYVPPSAGRRSTLRLLREILGVVPASRGTSLEVPASFLMRVLKRRSLIFLVSDLLTAELNGAVAAAGASQGAEGSLPPGLQRLAARHDLSVFRLSDPREEHLPAVGRVRLRDLESGRVRSVDTSLPAFQQAFQRAVAARREGLRRAFESGGADYAELLTSEPVVEPLVRFFTRKAARRKPRVRR